MALSISVRLLNYLRFMQGQILHSFNQYFYKIPGLDFIFIVSIAFSDHF